MFEELLELKAEAEKEILYAKAKIEVVDKLLAKFKPTDEPVVVEENVSESYETGENEMEGL